MERAAGGPDRPGTNGQTIILDSRIDDFLRYNDYTEDLDHDQLFNRKLRMTATGLRPVYE